MCPAWKRFGTAKTVKPGTVILHSGADDVVPFANPWNWCKIADSPGIVDRRRP